MLDNKLSIPCAYPIVYLMLMEVFYVISFIDFVKTARDVLGMSDKSINRSPRFLKFQKSIVEKEKVNRIFNTLNAVNSLIYQFCLNVINFCCLCTPLVIL